VLLTPCLHSPASSHALTYPFTHSIIHSLTQFLTHAATHSHTQFLNSYVAAAQLLPLMVQKVKSSELIVELQLWGEEHRDTDAHDGNTDDALLWKGIGSHALWNEIAWWQSEPIHPSDLPKPLSPPVKSGVGSDVGSDNNMKLTKVDEGWAVSGRGFRIELSCATGQLRSWRYRSTDMLRNNTVPSYWRPPTDNDYGYAFQERCWPWQQGGSSRRMIEGSCTAKTTTALDNEGVNRTVVVFTSRAALQVPPAVVYSASFVVHPSGHVEVHQSLVASGHGSWMPNECNSIPRVGWDAVFPQTFDKVSWYGRGPHETYADRWTGAQLGRWNGTVSEQYVYPHPHL
jgi:hypothetical protein